MGGTGSRDSSMIVGDLTETEVRHLHHALVLLGHVLGDDQLPPRLLRLRRQLNEYPAISRHSTPPTVSYREAAQILGKSVRTVSRMVAAGRLQTEGRRITTASLNRKERTDVQQSQRRVRDSRP